MSTAVDGVIVPYSSLESDLYDRITRSDSQSGDMPPSSNDSLSDSTLVNISEGLYWNKGSKIKNLKEIDFWIGKRAQVGKKIPRGFNKNLKFNI